MVAACEAMPILAHAMGAEAYAAVFAAQHAESLLRFLRASQPLDVRSAAVGAGPPTFSSLHYLAGQYLPWPLGYSGA